MMTSQILRSADFTKTHKSRYPENKTFFFQIKKNHNIKGYFMAKNRFVAEAIFNYDTWCFCFCYYENSLYLTLFYILLYKGVYLSRCADILSRRTTLDHIADCTLVVFKYMKVGMSRNNFLFFF